MILNVIHPYVYRLKGDTLIQREMSEYLERDRKVSGLIKRFLGVGRGVNWYQFCPNNNPLDPLWVEIAFGGDPFLSILLDSRIKKVASSEIGVPYSEKGLQLDEEMIFIGGALERCMTNSMGVHRILNGGGDKIRYIPELSVVFDKDELVESEWILERDGIKSVSLEEVMRFGS